MASLRRLLSLSSLFLLPRAALAQEIEEEIPDFQTYITRPEFRVPRFNLTNYIPEAVTPGYLFFSPYPSWDHPPDGWSPPLCLFGPHITDEKGNLVWSGGCHFDNRNANDFTLHKVNGTDYMTFSWVEGQGDNEQGVGMFLNNNYKIEMVTRLTPNKAKFNGHEFNVVNDGESALSVTTLREVVDGKQIGLKGEMRVEYNGFIDVEVATNRTIFEWSGKNHIALDECTYDYPKQAKKGGAGWDAYHMNSVDKFSNGDYFISCRHMDAMYRISGETGKILWRFGGKKNDFKLVGFKFMRQHNARILHEDGDRVTVSFFDNSAGNHPNVHKPANDHSSGRIVVLDTKKMVAHSKARFNRPDGQHSLAKGNVQILPNGNVFIGWGEKGYQSEHLPDGTPVQFGRFEPFSTYRVYKYNYTAYPLEQPTVKAFAYGTNPDDLLTVAYVSWNGATEADTYNFYAKGDRSGYHDLDFMGSAKKDGFETVFMWKGYAGHLLAEGVDKHGEPLPNGRSELIRVEPPENWKHSGWAEDIRPPRPAQHPGENQDEADADGSKSDGNAWGVPEETSATASAPPDITGGSKDYGYNATFDHADETHNSDSSHYDDEDEDGEEDGNHIISKHYTIFDIILPVTCVILLCCGTAAGAVWIDRRKRNVKKYAAIPDMEDQIKGDRDSERGAFIAAHSKEFDLHDDEEDGDDESEEGESSKGGDR